MKNFFGFGSSTPPSPPPRPPVRPPAAPASKSSAPKAPPMEKESIAAIVGRWKEPNGTDTTEFRADGTVVEEGAGAEIIHGRYSLEGTRLKIRLESLAEELVFSVSIRNDALEMKDANGQVTNYRRV